MSLHRIGQARADLHAAIVGVLDVGRVSAYPAAQDVGIQVWIDEHSWSVSGNGYVVDFPVHITSDGTDSAQVASNEDLTSRICDACLRVKGMQPQRSIPGPPRTIGSQTRRTQVLTVRVLIAAKTLCLPDDPGSSPIPPDQVQE